MSNAVTHVLTDPRLQADLDAVVSEIDDPAEAELLVTLFDLASRAEAAVDATDDYTPFVYPH